MIGCHNCGALSGLDPRGTCNACGKPCSYKVALEQLESMERTLANARPGALTSNTGYRLAEAETQLTAETRARESVEAELREVAGELERARALLERLRDCYADNQEGEDLVRDAVEFLDRAPAQPAAPEPSGDGRWSPLDPPDSEIFPPCKDCGFTSGHDPLCRQARLLRESAEAQLAAIEAEILAVLDGRIGCARALDNISAIIRPTPGTGGEGGER